MVLVRKTHLLEAAPELRKVELVNASSAVEGTCDDCDIWWWCYHALQHRWVSSSLLHCVRGGGGGGRLRRAATLPGLRLVEDLGHDELALALLLFVAQVVLVHHPVGLVRLAVLAEVGVEHQDLLAPTLLAGDHHRPRLAGLVPPRLAPLLLLLLRRQGGGGG